MPKRICVCTYPGCKNITANGRCLLHRKDERSSAGKRGYGYEWRKIRNEFAESHPYCESNIHVGMCIPMKIVDHIVPLVGGGTNDKKNLMSLCLSCHAIKTDKQTKRHRGMGI